jgi:hypothetical protein
LRFITAPDFQAKGSAANSNTYFVTVTANDGNGGTKSQIITVTVTDTMTFTSSATASVPENTTAVTTVTATTTDGGPITYSISGGTDQAKFTIDQDTGALSFISAPNFEAPGSAASSNTYHVTVKATDSQGNKTQDVTVTVTNANDAPTVANAISDQAFAGSGLKSFTFADNVFADADLSDTLTYSATLDNGDPLPGWLHLDPATRTFSGDPDAADEGPHNIKVTANDSHGGTVSDIFVITVSNADG